MKVKRFLTLMLCLVIIFSSFAAPAYADGGSGNIDHGGGSGMGEGGESWWNGDDGVRITVIRASDNKPVSYPVDLTNYNEDKVICSFIRKCKIQYQSGAALQGNFGTYRYVRPSVSMPTIITDVGTSNIGAIRSYFTDRRIIMYIAQTIGTSYDKLTNGRYKLLLEPIAYFYFHGDKFAMTATEAAMYDQLGNGSLRSDMVSLTHQQLPLSMFLQQSDLGFPAFNGNRSGRQSDSTIISQLGLGVVKFRNDGDVPTDSGGTDRVEYRCNTDVFTSVSLSSDVELNSNDPASVTFHILGGSYTVTDVVMPAGESQLVWVKWHTPSTPQTVNITVSSNDGHLSASTVNAKISAIDESVPPNPTATDRNDGFTTPSVPNNAASTSNSWSVWSYGVNHNWVWNPLWVWINHRDWASGGEWVDKGSWVDTGTASWVCNTYHAYLSANMDLSPDDKDPTAQGKNMKSGYGVKINVDSGVSSTVSSWATGAQTAITYFPEFHYNTYWRVLDQMSGGISSSFAFETNPYSTYSRRVHFTPVWYPDGNYTAYTYLEDAWTPAGMLSANLSDSVKLTGSVYDDWHIGPQMVN